MGGYVDKAFVQGESRGFFKDGRYGDILQSDNMQIKHENIRLLM